MIQTRSDNDQSEQASKRQAVSNAPNLKVQGPELVEIRLVETENNEVVYRGELA